MSVIFSNVNIDKMNFISGKYDIKFEFIDSIHGSIKYLGEIICKHIFLFKLDTAFEDDEKLHFPCFICDVQIIKLKGNSIESKLLELNYGYKDFNWISDLPNYTEYQLIRMEGGEVDITIICREVRINKV